MNDTLYTYDMYTYTYHMYKYTVEFFYNNKVQNFDLAFREKACLKVCALGTLESQVEKLARQVETFAPRMARWHVNCTSTQARWHVNHAGTQITLACRHTWHVN